MSQEITLSHREIWNNKPVLRAVYHNYYDLILSQTIPGTLLEVGGGSGNFASYLNKLSSSKHTLYSTDITKAPDTHVVSDAHFLPFANNSFDNIVMMDTLHHLERPLKFLNESYRVLKNKGRLILLEPGMTPLSILFFKLFHDEPIHMNVNPLEDGPLSNDRKPFDANQAIPDLIFNKFQAQFLSLFPNFVICKIQRKSVFAYPLSGGFKKWSLIPNRCIQHALKLDEKLEFLSSLLSFRLFIVIEKVMPHEHKIKN
ncbi:class I SAM-dependent methyltransferase [Candidatus Nucleicultrix amoebiphila]|jgi:SAM-dependent methyltransferase|uniref:Methyltransferase type 11 domain-containing protein n=1 Tax=Candidatus Nucleicultrix amoebiphila FS5 TaxID=1414854 RepID=A0A1W6N3X2_9PROT|nr:class I SAM-dependent methyltransferase [Candidatus Nucleicultrix amoebiphila]ARN84555.1 hypothetical protein GQ61_03640 [Candidatus Nucleicultrix amoebiphila FS5]